MSRQIDLPKIDARTATELLKQLRARAPHYTREWTASDNDDPGVGLLNIFSSLAAGVIHRLNRAPERNFLAFLEMLGIRRLPATPARVPVRLLLAAGTPDEVLVPKGTQVAAPPGEGQSEPIPFETLKDLLAIPAKLDTLIAVDPLQDKIYQPPPGFLERETAASDLPQLTTQAFSAAGTKFLQLEPAGQVQPGDFLRLQTSSGNTVARADCASADATNPAGSDSFEYVVAAAAKGTIITLTEPLRRAYPEQTPVQKLTQFELLAGKDFQAHVLYLGHNKYFEIKSEAQIELTVTLAPGASANLPARDIAWEFFGIDETQEPKEEKWHAFRVDGTAQALNQNGQLNLFKPKGEIKETEINGNKSRWIRARLVEPIPATPSPSLPKVEAIELRVLVKEEEAQGKKKGIPADQAFHNDTPLTLEPRFNPFGPEPRLFDRFYIASAEAFSKQRAKVQMELDLDFTDLLAAPAAVFQGGKVRAFAHGAAGRLVEFPIDPATANTTLQPINHRTPPNTRIVAGSIPAVVQDVNGVRVGVFVKALENANTAVPRIYLRFIPSAIAASQQWIDLQVLPGELTLDPAAVLRPDNKWQVFAVVDNQLSTKLVNPLDPNPSAPPSWTPFTPPVPKPIASTPFALEGTGISDPIWVVVTDTDGHTWVFKNGTWNDITPKDGGGIVLPAFLARQLVSEGKPFSPRPHALAYKDGSNNPQVRIFLRNGDDELVVFDTEPTTPVNRGTPPNALLDSSPYAVSREGSLAIFVRGKDNRMWETGLTGAPGVGWLSHLNPSEVNLAGEPFALSYKLDPTSPSQGEFVSVLSTSDKNALLEFRIQGKDGVLQAGPLEILLLNPADTLASGKTYFVRITSGPGAGAIRKINSALSKDSFAVLEEALPDVPTVSTHYELFEQLGTGPESAGSLTASPDKLELQTLTQATSGDYIFVPGSSLFPAELHKILSISTSTNIATLADNWINVPTSGDDYFVLKLLTTNPVNPVKEGSVKHAVLAATASLLDDFYNGLFFEIRSGVGASPVAREIDDYFGNTRHVVLKSDFAVSPQKGSNYRIAAIAVPDGWLVYRDPAQSELRPELSWEYWNGNGWVLLKIDDDSTENFLVPGHVKFSLPEDLAKTDVAGQVNYWIRARIIGGDYGRELFSLVKDQTTGIDKLVINKDPIRPPLIKKLTLSYEITKPQAPQYCLTFNNLTYLDQTAANNTDDKHYFPYLPLPVERPALYFGFDKEFQGDPVRLYCAAKELTVNERNKPKLDWAFTINNDWQPLPTEDDTDALTKPEFITWTVPGDFQRRQFFGAARYWVRAALAETSVWDEAPVLEGLFPNTVAAWQARTVLNEILGSSTATAHQQFRFAQRPVLPGEEVRVRETLTQQEHDELTATDPKAILDVLDQAGARLETWVRWREVIEFFKSKPGDRHYRLDRASGEIEFGDNVHGRIPPAGGDNLRVFAYQAGGGPQGNVAVGAINAAVTAIAGVEKVSNPVAAGGGSAEATPEEMMELGPAQISHRDRAVTADDFERLAKEASREVRKVRCLPNRNQAGRNELGWVTLQIVPNSTAAQPLPSLELRRAVQRYLAERAEATLVAQEHIFVGAPQYVPVSVEVTLRAKSFDVAGRAEAQAQERLTQFLHPLTGGPAGEGWDFGRGLAASDLYLLLENIEEIDHVEALSIRRGAGEAAKEIAGELLDINAHALLASGTHKITIKVANGA